MNWLAILNLTLPLVQALVPLVIQIAQAANDSNHPQAQTLLDAAGKLQESSVNLATAHKAANGNS